MSCPFGTPWRASSVGSTSSTEPTAGRAARSSVRGPLGWIPGPAEPHPAAPAPVLALAPAVARSLGFEPPAGELEIAFRGPTPGGEPRFPSYDVHLLDVLI